MNLFMEISQWIFPLALLAWLWFAPAQTMITYLLQALGVGLALLAISLTAVWGIVTWWSPYFFGLIWFSAILFRLVNYGIAFEGIVPSGRGWIGFLVGAALAIAGGIYSIAAIDGRQMPEGDFVDLSSPFASGNYRVANGGFTELINSHLKLLTVDQERYQRWRGQSYGVDFIRVGRLGFHKNSLTSKDPATYEIFGTPVTAPCTGEVIASRNNLPDNLVGSRDTQNKAGNFVFLVCQGNDILLAHLKLGSVTVKEGDRVSIGDQLGQVGNSGQSDQPHLHMHAQERGAPGQLFSGTPLPMKIDGRILVRNDLLLIDAE